ncbi:MAG: NAD-dependent protein deacylase [Bacilli bacterium]
MDQFKLEVCKKRIRNAKKIVFFGGAGVSTASGIPDFRSPQGLYNIKSKYGIPYEVMLSRTFFEKNPKTFFDFYKNTMINLDAKPNKAHLALADFQKRHHNIVVITQNIDNLHNQAGSTNVLELHGSEFRNYCTKCHKFFPIEDVKWALDIPQCECGGIIKPDVVLYEESLDYSVLEGAMKACQEADVMIVGGTSLNVYPAASLVNFYRGDSLIVINKEGTVADKQADYVFHDDITKVLPLLLED